MEHQDGTFKSHLEEKKGVSQPPTVSKSAAERFKEKRKQKRILSTDEYVAGITSGNMTILSQAITLIESNLKEHYNIAQEIIKKCLPYSGNSVRIGITGVPGAGKSTFIESFGKLITNSNKKLAVLAIDPSSERTKGSILGDKTRMEELATDPNAFIRPSPSAGSLGGVARKTRETIILCEAAGFNVIFIETVGVGQSETAVHSMVDFFLLLMLSGAGDELQGIKRGIIEMSDSIAITKADGQNIHKAEIAMTEYRTALHLFPAHDSGVNPEVMTCSSLEKNGLTEIWQHIEKYITFTKNNKFFYKKRSQQAKYWMYESINEQLKKHFYSNSNIKEIILQTEKDVVEGNKSSFTAAQELLNSYFKNKE